RRRAGPGGHAGRARRRPALPRPGRAAERHQVRRSKAPELVVGLDVGTTKICAVVGEPRPGGGLDIVGVGNAPSRGLRRGIVVNIDSTVEAIKQAVAEAEQMAGVEVAGVYAGVAGGHVRSLNSAGLAVQDVVLEPIASAEAVLFPDEKELGVVLIDIGGGTTDMALFRDGAVWHTAVLPLGGDHITNDVAVGLRTPMADAEALKKRYGCALTSLVPAEETVDVPSVGGRKPRELSRQ